MDKGAQSTPLGPLGRSRPGGSFLLPGTDPGPLSAYEISLNQRCRYQPIGPHSEMPVTDHTLDHLKHDWDTFHWFGFRPVSARLDEKGFLALESRIKRAEVKTKSVRQDIEAILGRA